MDILKQYPSRYLNVSELEDLGGEVTGTITKIELEELKNQAGQSEQKPVMHLEGLKSGVVISKSNAISLAEQLGRNTSSWMGKQVTVRLEQWGPAAAKKQWMAIHPAEKRTPTKKVAQKAQALLDGLNDEVA